MSRTRKKLQLYREGTRTPDPSRLVETKPRRKKEKRYEPVSFALAPAESTWVDEITTILRDSGRESASRSLVVREAILSLQQLLDGKDATDIYRYFSEQELRRAQKR